MADPRQPGSDEGDPPTGEPPEKRAGDAERSLDPTLPARSDATGERSRGKRSGPLVPPRYHVMGYLGGGGMGHVIRALDRELGREVAIKALDTSLHDDETGTARLKREARAIAGLRHPAIVAVYDIDVEAGMLVMELLPGGTLRDRMLRAGALGVERSLAIIRPVLEALEVIHEAGVVHRDIKPSNILLDEKDNPKLCDFGIVQTLDSEETGDGDQPGTPAYMAPEQLEGRRTDARSDIYSAGVTLFEMLTGRRYKNEPVKSRTELASVLRHDGIPGAVADAVATATQTDPELRFATARDFLDALKLDPPRQSSRAWWVAAALGVVLAGTAGLALTRTSDEPSAATQLAGPSTIAFLPFDDRTGSEELDFTPHGVPRALGNRVRRAFPERTIVGYDALRDVIPPSDDAPSRWLEAARDRGAEIAVDGRVEREGGQIRVTAFYRDLTRDPTGEGAPEAEGEIVASGRVSEVAALIAQVARELADTLYGRAPPELDVGAGYSLDALREYQRGVDALRRADFDTAITALEAVVALEPDYHDAWYHLAVARSWSGGVGNREGFEALDRALATTDDEREQKLLEAFRLMAEQKPEAAADLLEPVHEAHPHDRDVLYTIGEAYHHGGDVASGLNAFRAAMRVAPGFLPSVIHPSRVYRATRDEENARQCMEVRAAYGQPEEAAADEWLILFAIRQYDAVVERELPEERVERQAALLARLGVLLARGQDQEAIELLESETELLYHPIARWGAQTVLAAIEYRRGLFQRARQWAAQAAVRASERTTPSRRGEHRAALGIVRAMARDRAGAQAELVAVDAEQYPPRVPRAVLVLRAVAGHLLGREELLAGALEASDRDVRLLAEGLQQEMQGDHGGAAATLALAIDEPTEGYYDIVILDALARNRHAIGDLAGVRTACAEIEQPAVYHPYREPALDHCRTLLTGVD